MKIRDFRRKLASQFENCDSVDISLILCDTLNLSKTELLSGDREVTIEEEKEVSDKVSRLERGEPVQYIIGKCEFMSLSFYVRKGILIPRQDTEVLVEVLIERLNNEKPLKVIDMCTGSGCIGISLAYYMKNISVSLCDISEVALDTAKENAKRHIEGREYNIFKMNLLEDFPDEEYDCIVSNPPYIRTDVIEGLDRKVKDFEPDIALDGGCDGLVFYRRIAKEAKLKKGGILAFEIGFDQGKEVSDILNENGFTNIEVIKDIENRDRVVLGIKEYS